MSNSSYINNVTYLDIIAGITVSVQPKKIIEFGILNGHSLKTFYNYSDKNTQIYAYDIFDDFNGNSANKIEIDKRFKNCNNVTIEYGDYYSQYKSIDDNSIDILHIDIANNKEVYNFCIDNYLTKISDSGCIILEGGSKERDEVEWMNKYNKPKIFPYIEQLKERDDIVIETIGTNPSITILKKIIHK